MTTQVLRNIGHAHFVARYVTAFAAILNHDFCPRANRWVYWMKQPLCWLVAACAASIACGLCVNPHVFVLTAMLAATMLVGIAWPALAVRGLACRVLCTAQRVREGRPASIRLRIVNRWPWPVWGLSLERGFVLDGTAGVTLARVPGWSTGEFEWTWVPAVRGVYPFQRPRVATAFPFGLWSAACPAEVTGELIVWPRSVMLPGLPDAAEPAPYARRLTERRAGDCGDRLGTRVFRGGDSLRRVHWTQTARQQRMIVNELQSPASTAVQVLIDLTGSPESQPVDEGLELRIRIAASVCESLHAQHAHVCCVIGTQAIHLTGASGMPSLLDALARIPRHGLPVSNYGRLVCFPENGAFRILITSDRSAATPAGTSKCGNRLLCVVVTNQGPLQTGESPAPRIELDLSAPGVDLLDELRHRWRRVCHAA